ncbi:MAG: hypothetical protein ACE14M_04625 [Terriglobales bacterium]
MQVRHENQHKMLTAFGAGISVWVMSFIAQFILLPMDRGLVVRQVVANFIPALMAVVVTLAIQLRHEEVHNRTLMERAMTTAELNHHVRNAVFPLFVTIHRLGDEDAKRSAEDAVERINAALKDATADALAGRIAYAASGGTRQAA